MALATIHGASLFSLALLLTAAALLSLPSVHADAQPATAGRTYRSCSKQMPGCSRCRIGWAKSSDNSASVAGQGDQAAVQTQRNMKYICLECLPGWNMVGTGTDSYCQSAGQPDQNTASGNNEIFYGPTQPNLCNIGPSYWCKDKDSYRVCMTAMLPETYQQVGVCGYATANCTQSSLTAFCQTNPTATSFNGGINGSPTGYFGYYALAMTWVSSSCRSNSTLGGFCSTWTTGTSYSATHLVLHGLWPDYGSIYAPPGPQPPFFNGTQASYQGWPQWCDGAGIQTSQCAVGPNNLCPWDNKTVINQNELERCLRVEGITECLVDDSVMDVLGPQFQKIAPGFVDPNGKPTTFMDHEYFKHGSCIGGYLSHNITAYYDISVQWAWKLTGPGTPADTYIHKNVGGKVRLADLQKGLNQQAVPTCKRGTCNLDEVWYCMGRDAAGFPTNLITCPLGTLASNTCATQGCEYVNIPSWQ